MLSKYQNFLISTTSANLQSSLNTNCQNLQNLYDSLVDIGERRTTAGFKILNFCLCDPKEVMLESLSAISFWQLCFRRHSSYFRSSENTILSLFLNFLRLWVIPFWIDGNSPNLVARQNEIFEFTPTWDCKMSSMAFLSIILFFNMSSEKSSKSSNKH